MTGFLEAADAAGIKSKDGKQAIKTEYRPQLTVKGGAYFSGSIDLDAHFATVEPQATRWDYGVGFHAGREFALWIEPHPASGSREVAVMIRKLDWLKAKLRTPEFDGLADLTRAAQARGEIPFRWLYKGRTSFRVGGKEARQLAQNGMRLPERIIRVG